jgi:hypothetical protein
MNHRWRAWLLSALAPLGALADVPGWSVTVDPSRPVAQEPVYARVTFSQTCAIDPTRTTVRQDGSSLIVTVFSLPDCVAGPGSSTQDISLGQFHPGTFAVFVRAPVGIQLTSAPFLVVDAQPFAQPAPLVNYTDMWWNPQESGWGMNLTQHPSGRLFASWYTYDASGTAIWFTLQPGQWTSPTTFTGPIYRTTGPNFATPFDPSRITVAQVGTGTFTFDSPRTANFSYTVNGVAGARRIERMVF